MIYRGPLHTMGRAETARDEDAMTQTPMPDLAAIKARQQQTWATGDFAVVGSLITIVSEHLCEAVDLRAGWTVLDVATGSGNTALAAAGPPR